MRFTFLAARRTSSCLVFLGFNKTDGHHCVSSCNSFFFCRHPFSSTATCPTTTSADEDNGRTVDRSSSAPSSPVISYLIEKCGLSTESALSVSKKIKLRFPKKSDSVLRLLRDHGFSDKQISSLIIKHPLILSFQSNRNLRPKLEFLLSEGFTHQQIVDIVLNNSYVVLKINLERKIIPCITFIKSVLPSNDAVIRFLRLTGYMSVPLWLANIQTLRSAGAPESVIQNMFTLYPTCMSRSRRIFAKEVEKTLDLGFDPSRVLLFSRALGMLLSMKPSTWERKMMLYRSLGFSNEETVLLFKNSPLCFGLSDKLIKKKMDFFTQKLGYDPKRLICHPDLLRSSLEKRIIPRCSVLSVLVSKGLIKTMFICNLKLSDAKFSVRFVAKYKDRAPEVVEAYKGNLAFKGLPV